MESVAAPTPLEPKLRYIIIHHTYISCDHMPVQSESIERSHKNRGYIQSPTTGYFTAYHYMVGCDGTVKKNRADSESSTHTGCGLGENRCINGFSNVNEHSIAVVVAGDFTGTNKPSETQVKITRELVKKISLKYGIPKENIVSHSSVSPTSCPANLYESVM